MTSDVYVTAELFEQHPRPWRAEPAASLREPGRWIVLDAAGHTVARSLCQLAADALVQIARGRVVTAALTVHAIRRARERAGLRPDPGLGVRLPRSLLRRLRAQTDTKAHRMNGRRGVVFRATASLILVVVADRVVVTTLRLDVDDLAEVLVHVLFRTSAWREA